MTAKRVLCLKNTKSLIFKKNLINFCVLRPDALSTNLSPWSWKLISRAPPMYRIHLKDPFPLTWPILSVSENILMINLVIYCLFRQIYPSPKLGIQSQVQREEMHWYWGFFWLCRVDSSKKLQERNQRLLFFLWFLRRIRYWLFW